MTGLLSSVLLGALAFTLILWKSYRWNKGRLSRKYDYPLFPNCLITRSPLVFVGGRTSPFYYGKYWNFIPQFLRDHGYEVIEIDFNWKDHALREKELNSFLELLREENLGGHFFADSSQQGLFDQVPRELKATLKSISFLGEKDYGAPPVGFEPLSFRVHRMLGPKYEELSPRTLGLDELTELKDLGRFYLRRCVELAESELQHGEHHERGNREPASFQL